MKSNYSVPPLRALCLCAMMTALTTAGAFLRIPAGVSSFTLQFLFTALAGILLGPRWGALSQMLYLLLGLTGLPVFAGGGGLGYVLRPSFGFLLGLIPAAALTGRLSASRSSFRALLAACTAGLAALYAVGLPYLHLIQRLYLRRSWTPGQTLLSGMLIFLPWDALKLGAAAALGRRLRPLIGQNRTK